MKRRFLFILTFVLGFTGCKISGSPDDTGPLACQTQIIVAHAVPNTVAPGDTVRFVCEPMTKVQCVIICKRHDSRIGIACNKYSDWLTKHIHLRLNE